ncbi:MAG: SDR family oxidoreductase [Bacteroidales bacterium]|jgi:UDP-N-acetylglucosamine 4-epimerase|nr:SDR family oxidoreductase [Bacteroidales bacterium]MDY0313449.1 SDR family oxidoreductase [Bacteroidales bacterium]NLB86137.1 SDR family oxidoreductase [Bacteroidales bacterium]
MQNNKSEIKNSKVLITGGAGFIGSNLIEKLLRQNNYIVCLDNFSTGKKENINQFIENKNFKLINADIRDLTACKNACERIDIVLHHAALGSVPRSITDPISSNEVNITGFLNMLVAARDNKVKRFVYASSSSVYGDNPCLPKLEENIGNALSPYAVTKNVNEMYAKVFSDLYGLETIGLRYFNVFGKNQDPESVYAAVFPKFIKQLINLQSPTIHGDGGQSRDFTFIENVIQANELAATNNNPKAINTVYNIAYGEANNLNEITNLLINLLAKFKPEIAGIKPIHGPERQGDIKNSLASIEKAKTLLNYKPKFDVKRGLELTVKWYYENLK